VLIFFKSPAGKILLPDFCGIAKNQLNCLF
jgi:hypothetical protein